MDIFKITDSIKSEKIALISENGEWITYRTLNQYIEELQKIITAKSVVLILGKNNIETVVFYVASLMADSAVLMANENTKSDDIFLKYNPRYIVVNENGKEKFVGYKVLFSFMSYIILEKEVSYKISNQIALLLSTSGSTGSPKCVKISWENLEENTKSIVRSLHIINSDIAITTLPINYTYGLSIINTHLYVGGTVILNNYSVIKREFWELFCKYKGNNFGGVPFTYETLLKLNILNESNMRNVRYLTQAGGNLDKEKTQKMYEKAVKMNFKFIVMYGQTEATARMSYLPWEKIENKIGSIGVPIYGGMFRLFDDTEGFFYEPNKIGELVYTGPNVALGYSDKYLDLLNGEDEWNHILYTGDMACVDSDGFYYILGRKKRFIKICGNRISLYDIECILQNMRLEAVCAGEDEKLYILIKNRYSAEIEKKVFFTLMEEAKIHSNFIKIIFVNDFPRNEFGKVVYSIKKWEIDII